MNRVVYNSLSRVDYYFDIMQTLNKIDSSSAISHNVNEMMKNYPIINNNNNNNFFRDYSTIKNIIQIEHTKFILK